LPLFDATANNSILEAAACGVPVITNNLEGTKEYSCGEYAYYYNNKQDCLDYLIHLLTDENELLKRSLAAREYAIQNFSIKRIAAEHARLYKQFI